MLCMLCMERPNNFNVFNVCTLDQTGNLLRLLIDMSGLNNTFILFISPYKHTCKLQFRKYGDQVPGYYKLKYEVFHRTKVKDITIMTYNRVHAL